MALKFLYITNDPFVNNSEEFVRILAVFQSPSPVVGYAFAGVLSDQNGENVAFYHIWNGTQGTSSTAYPFAFGGYVRALEIIIIPPGWKFSNFTKAIAVQGSLEEVLRVH